MRFLFLVLSGVLLIGCFSQLTQVLPDNIVGPVQDLPSAPTPIPSSSDNKLLPFEHFMKLEKEWRDWLCCTGWLPVPDDDTTNGQAPIRPSGHNGLIV
ncbi:MAG: hypothetical protein ACKKL5_00140 [Candidatus Komeilibacteria bacterium]